LTVALPARLAIATGDGQSGLPGTRVAIGVKVVDAASLPIGNVQVSFSVASGQATLNPPTALTGADGVATIQVTLGANAGPVRITAASAGLTSVSFSLTITPATPGTPVPQIDAGGVKGAGF